MAIFSLFKCNQSDRIDVRIGDGTVKITTILTVRAMLTSKKYSGGQEINRGGKNKNRGGMPPMPPRWRRAWMTLLQLRRLHFAHLCTLAYPSDPLKGLWQGIMRGTIKPKKERVGDRDKENWLVVTEYYLVVPPDAFQSSLEVDFCCKTGSNWSYGSADKIRESLVFHMEYNYGVHSSTMRSKDGRDKSVSLIRETLKKEKRTKAYLEMQGGIFWSQSS